MVKSSGGGGKAGRSGGGGDQSFADQEAAYNRGLQKALADPGVQERINTMRQNLISKKMSKYEATAAHHSLSEQMKSAKTKKEEFSIRLRRDLLKIAMSDL